MPWIAPKRFFFDRAAVINAVGKARAKVMGKAGAFIQRTAKFSIRNRKKPSRPGQAPTNQSGLLREFIYFQYDPSTQSVVVGPAKLNQKNIDSSGSWAKGLAPQVLEFGGTFGVLEEQLSGGLWVRRDNRRKQNDRPKRVRRVQIAPRPFMRPALEKNRDKIAKFWQNALIQVRS